MSDEGFIVAEFPDGVQVIPKSWLQSEGLCKYPSHYTKDTKIRKAVKKEETPGSDWPTYKIIRVFGEYPSLEKADAKAKVALYTSDMDTEQETANKFKRKFNAQKIYSSSDSEESCTDTLPAPPAAPPVKRQRCNKIQHSSGKDFTIKDYKISSQASSLNSHSLSVQGTNDGMIEVKKVFQLKEVKMRGKRITRKKTRYGILAKWEKLAKLAACEETKRQ